jgi:hypothetical protein
MTFRKKPVRTSCSVAAATMSLGRFDTDWLEGQMGNDTLYGGSGIDFMVLDTRREYFAPLGVDQDDLLPPVYQFSPVSIPSMGTSTTGRQHHAGRRYDRQDSD